MLAIASSLAPMSLDFFAPSLPDATRALGVSTETVRFTLYIFLIGYGVAPFFWGLLADRLGRHKIMLSGIIVYILASAGCFFASGIPELSAMRFIQGVGAASGVVVARAVLRDIHGPAGVTKAISGMFLIMVWVPITVPILGGYLGSNFHWKASFIAMVLIGGMTFLGSLFWQWETIPTRNSNQKYRGTAWLDVIRHPTFVRYALANMFCIGNMLIFLSNYSYLAERYFQLTSTGNGYVLAGFNASISAGVYLVRLAVPIFGVDKTIYLGAWVALAGWAMLWLFSMITSPTPANLLLPMVIACLGTGMVISLTVGRALAPFTYAAGTASALFVCVQSAGSSLISFLASLGSEITLTSMTTMLLLCSLLVLVSMSWFSSASDPEIPVPPDR